MRVEPLDEEFSDLGATRRRMNTVTIDPGMTASSGGTGLPAANQTQRGKTSPHRLTSPRVRTVPAVASAAMTSPPTITPEPAISS
ncbi:MAG: hypothetical protein GEV07_00980 [Streptosporangiales bacterium]|nr:hypothetical protein [Streptosporangiales bacterium]